MQASEIPAGTISVPAPRADTLEPTFVVPYRQYAYRDAAPTNGGYSLGPMNVGFRLSSANKDIVRERRAALVNAREADRNSTAIRSGITKRAIDMVGKNLRLQSMPNFEALGLTEDWAAEFANQWENEFSLWGDDPRKLNDASRHNNFGSQMFEVCRNTYGADGEAALIIRYDERRQDMYRAHMATFVEVINPVRISNREGLRDGLDYCQGKVLDEWGAYTALDIEVEDPSAVAHRLRWERVMRETEWGRPIGVHWFPRYLAGAQRAMPAILGMLRGNRMLDTFDDKLLEQAVKAAFMSIYIKTDATSAEALAKLQPAPSGATDPFLAAMNARFGLYDELNVEGQSLPVLAPGDDIAVADAKNTTPDTDSFRFAFERKFANHLGLGYARYSNDYSKTSFASIRAEFIDAWRMTYADRYDFCQSVPAQIALAHLEECIVRNKIILPPNAPPFYENMTAYAQCEFRGPGMGWVDPVKDVKGANLRIAGGLSSPQAEAAAQGSDYYDNIAATARAQKYAKEKLGHEIDYASDGAAVEELPEPDEEALDAAAAAAAANQPE